MCIRDSFSLAGVPQILDLASKHRSLLLGARAIRAKAPPTSGPIFATPRGGMAALTDALGAAIRAAGVDVRLRASVTTIERVGTDSGRWRVLLDGDALECAGVARMTPPHSSASPSS